MTDQAAPFQCRMVPPAPAAQASEVEVAHTAWRFCVVLLGTITHAEPFQCKTVPASPTAHTSADPLTPPSACVVGLCCIVHVDPLRRRITPPSPTAHSPETPLSDCVVGLGTCVHDEPSLSTSAPFVPTAHSSVIEAPHTPVSVSMVLLPVQAMPFQRRTVPALPTAQTSEA